MLSKWVYILIGNDLTGKTTFQKELLTELCGKPFKDRLACNIVWDIDAKFNSRLKNIFLINRSLQEKDFNDKVADYFTTSFHDADICILSSHLKKQDIEDAISECHKRYYNVGGVFWENSIYNDPVTNKEIASLNWDERFVLPNTFQTESDLWQKQISGLAKEFCTLLLERAKFQ